MDEYTLILVIVSITCALIAQSIFRSKGRSPWSGFFLGLLLSVIGVIIAAVMPATQEGLEKKGFQDGELVQCPYCKEYIKPGATICKHCHQELSPDDVVLPTVEDQSLTYKLGHGLGKVLKPKDDW